MAFEFARRLPRHVRGARHCAARRGEVDAAAADRPRASCFAYGAWTACARPARSAFSEPPWRLTADRADFMFALAPGEQLDLYRRGGPRRAEPPEPGAVSPTALAADAAAARARQLHARAGRGCRGHRRRLRRLAASSRAPTSPSLTTDLPTGALSLRRHPLVLDALRPRRHHHRLADAVARPVAGQGVLTYLAARQATDALGLRRRRARQDHARDPARRDGRAEGDAVRPLLRRRRHHAAVRRPGRRLPRPHRRRRADPPSSGRRL